MDMMTLAPTVTRTPYFRAYLLGPFSLEHLASTPRQRAASSTGYTTLAEERWGDRITNTVGLFKLLLCSEKRHATKGWLAEQLWPDYEERNAKHSLTQVIRNLRATLKPTEDIPSLLSETPGGEGLYLAPQSVLWTDMDAFEETAALARQAEREEKSALALALWEHAYQLGRAGSFLPDDLDLEGTSTRRRRYEQLWPRCVRRLGECYLGEERASEAEEVLAPFWNRHPTDEEALVLLMDALGLQGHYREALNCYEQSVSALQEELDCAPLPATTAIAEYIRRQRLTHKPDMPLIEPHPASEQPPKLDISSSPDLSLPAAHAILESVREQTTLPDAESDEALERRDATKYIGMLGLTLLASPYDTVAGLHDAVISLPRKLDPEILDHFSALMTTSVQLYKGGQLALAERVLWSYLPTVEAIAHQPSAYQKSAASITSQSYRWASGLAAHRNDLKARQQFCQQALLYGALAQERSLELDALHQLATTFEDAKRPLAAIETCQRALPYLNEVSPDLQALCYATLSGVYGQTQQKQEAARFMGLAQEHASPDASKLFGMSDMSATSSYLVFLWDGLNHLNLGEPAMAVQILAQVDAFTPTPKLIESHRMELLNLQARAFAAAGHLQEACLRLQASVQGAVAMTSQRRLQEATTEFQTIRALWPDEAQVRSLGDLFRQHGLLPNS